MNAWTPRRFWSHVDVVENMDGWTVVLDHHVATTPAKSALNLPTRQLADAIAREWAVQGEIFSINTMPLTKLANAAIDKVSVHKCEVSDTIVAYGDSDLLCYRADGPVGLIGRQSEQWDPVLNQAARELDAQLAVHYGVMHVPQSKVILGKLETQVKTFDSFGLIALYELVTLTGSLVLGLAAIRDWRDPDVIWQLSRVDETWQEEQWGRDEEAHYLAACKRDAFCRAKQFYDLAQGISCDQLER